MRNHLENLRKHDTPTVCNAIELFNVRPRETGYMNQDIKACFPKLPPMVGFAVTSTFRASVAGKHDVYACLEKQVESYAELPGPAIMVFEDLDTPNVAATFGEIMCTVYKSFGAQGLISSGTGRDLDQVEAIDFPIFTNGTVCSHGYCSIPKMNLPVKVGGIEVTPGALLHGDCNGVTTIPMEILDELPDVCAEFMKGEAALLDYLHGDNPTIKDMNEARLECDAIIDAMRKKVAR